MQVKKKEVYECPECGDYYDDKYSALCCCGSYDVEYCGLKSCCLKLENEENDIGANIEATIILKIENEGVTLDVESNMCCNGFEIIDKECPKWLEDMDPDDFYEELPWNEIVVSIMKELKSDANNIL